MGESEGRMGVTEGRIRKRRVAVMVKIGIDGFGKIASGKIGDWDEVKRVWDLGDMIG